MAELQVRPMGVDGLDVRIRYFHEATDEHLHLLHAQDRRKGYGSELVRRSGRTYVLKAVAPPSGEDRLATCRLRAHLRPTCAHLQRSLRMCVEVALEVVGDV